MFLFITLSLIHSATLLSSLSASNQQTCCINFDMLNLPSDIRITTSYHTIRSFRNFHTLRLFSPLDSFLFPHYMTGSGNLAPNLSYPSHHQSLHIPVISCSLSHLSRPHPLTSPCTNSSPLLVVFSAIVTHSF